ncbi:MAG: single-stranded-DNA-specific exonuclease RecJ [Cytophagaceae bacterium]
MKRWSLLNLPDKHSVQSLAEAIQVSLPLATLLVQRGVTTFEAAKNFFRPTLDMLHNPFLMKDMDKAVDRIKKAIQQKESIMIFGDYDVDGTTSVAMVYDYLRQYYNHLHFYVPDRYSEGYGVSKKGIDTAKELDVTLMISLDCGIKSVDLVAYAQTLNIDFIICDHHLPDEILPPAVAILDPKRPDCEYPYKELSGCGVGFKLLQALTTRMEWEESPLLQRLDFVAISTCADIVPITGENRVLTYYGLKIINDTPRPGLQAMIDIIGYKPPIDVQKVVFGFAPRINAAGRIEHAMYAVQLLLAQTKREAEELVEVVNQYNIERKGADETITIEAIDMIQEMNQSKEYVSTVLYKKDWNKGVIGIVASRCIEQYHRPTIILTQSNGKVAGSARSVPGFDLHEAIGRCSDLLIQYGGHKYAAGLTMYPEQIDAFRERFDEVVKSSIEPELLIPSITVDIELDLNEISFKFFNILKQMAPFGPCNMQPVFVSRKVMLAKPPMLMKDKHVKLFVQHEGSEIYEAVGFNMGAHFPALKAGSIIDICYSIAENDFNSKKSLQLMLRDIQIPDKVS